MSEGWRRLTPEQQTAAKAAGRMLADEGLLYLMLLFGDDERGAIIGNIEPVNSIRLIEAALKAAKTMIAGGVEVEEIKMGTLQ